MSTPFISTAHKLKLTQAQDNPEKWSVPIYSVMVAHPAASREDIHALIDEMLLLLGQDDPARFPLGYKVLNLAVETGILNWAVAWLDKIPCPKVFPSPREAGPLERLLGHESRGQMGPFEDELRERLWKAADFQSIWPRLQWRLENRSPGEDLECDKRCADQLALRILLQEGSCPEGDRLYQFLGDQGMPAYAAGRLARHREAQAEQSRSPGLTRLRRHSS